MALNSEYIIKTLEHVDNTFMEKLGIELAYLAGSVVTNTNNWWSDVDIFVLIPNIDKNTPEEKFNLYFKIENYFSDKISNDNVQISFLDKLPLHIQFEVITKGILIYKKDDQKRIEFTEYVLKYYYDHMIWYSKMRDKSLGIKHEY